MIKRVIGLPGDTVSLRNNQLIINGQAAQYSDETEQILPAELLQPLSHTRVVRTTLGDQRPIMLFKRTPLGFNPVSTPLPSRRINISCSATIATIVATTAIGFVSRSAILGRASSVAFSFDVDNYYLPRGDRLMRSLRS